MKIYEIRNLEHHYIGDDYREAYIKLKDIERLEVKEAENE